MYLGIHRIRGKACENNIPGYAHAKQEGMWKALIQI
jgi:hypothetical protein